MKLITTNGVGLWFGSEDSYWSVVEAQSKLEALQHQGESAFKTAILAAGGGRGSDPFALPSLLSVENGTGIIDISGDLVNGAAGFMRLFGVLGYSDIAGAINEALVSKDVKRIMLSIDSGGGAVNGLEELGNLIRTADAIKPTYSHTDGDMGSAAYWLGASAREVNASRTAKVGSVGTLIVHTDISQALAAEGIKKTLITYGKYKAVGNPYTPLSKEDEAQIQALADEAGQIFVEYVSGRRGMTPAKFQSTAGEGRVFMGEQARKVGLVDTITSLSSFLLTKSLDSSTTAKQNSRNSSKDTNMKAQLSLKFLLAIVAGAALSTLDFSAVDANANGIALEATDIAALKAEAEQIVVARDAAVTGKETTLKATMQTQIDALQAQVTTLTAENTTLKEGSVALTAKVTDATALAASYAGIVKSSMSNMGVALGGAADAGASLAGAELLAEHGRMAEKFKAKFPTGGVAAVNIEHTEVKETQAGPPAAFLANVKSLNRNQAKA